MYIVKLMNGEIITPIHDEKEKLKIGNVVKGVNAIDSFSFTLLPSNDGYNRIRDFQTLVTVYNTNKNRYEFYGRVLYSRSAMDASGLITKEVTCESYLGFLCDSQQTYIAEQNWTVMSLIQHIIDTHNAQVEEYKRFSIGEVTVTDPNDNLYLGIQRENTWETINKKLIETLGGEIRFRVVDGVTYLDYLTEIGETKATKIALSRNMKSISKENDPSAYVTRLIPLGCKIADVDGNETEERLDITGVNDGKNYIDDETAIATYGIHVGYQEWDDVTTATALLNKGKAWLIENNKVQVKYSITALDLSLLGLEIDDFDVHNYHPIENALLGIDDVARIIKKNINVCEEIASTIEVGDNFKTLSEIQYEQAEQLKTAAESLKVVQNTTNNLKNEVANLDQTVIEQSTSILTNCHEIILSALESYVQTGNFEEYKETVSTALEIMKGEIEMNFTTTTEQITNVDGDLQTKWNELSKYIRFSGDTAITIGSGDSAITLEIDNETGIIFRKNGVQFGWWDGTEFHTGNIVVEVNERAQFGNFAFIPRTDGSLSFLKVGG